MNITLFDGRVLRSIETQLLRAIDMIPKEKSKINKKYNRYVYNGLETIAQTAIEDFYNSYDDGPWMYRRTENLYNSFKITATDNDWNIDVDSKYMNDNYNVSKDYIYDLTMKKGIHGGAPHNGDYYWRTPFPEFFLWYPFPAERGPEDAEGRIINESNSFIDEMRKQRQADFDEFMENKIMSGLRNSFSRLLR